jgi:hypothetical protein
MVAPRPFGILGQQVAPAQQGILGDWSDVDSYFQDNQSAMLGLAAGLLQPGSFGAGLASGLQGYQQGQQLDERRTGKRDERSAFLDMAKANGLSPQYIKMGLASESARQAMLAQMMTPKKPEYLEFGNQLLRVDGPNGPEVVMQGQTKPDYSDPAYMDQFRRKQAEGLGIAPDDPRYATFVATGRFPREDAQPLTATDKKAILEADDAVSANQSVIKALQEAKKVSPRANSGWTAGIRAGLSNNLPDWMVDDSISSPDSGLATVALDNIVTGQALAQMKTIFGAAPTEGERKILLELQGSVNLPDAARQEIYDRAIEMANRRLAIEQQRAQQLRGQDYYKPGGGSSAGGVPGALPEGVTQEDLDNMTPEERRLFGQ